MWARSYKEEVILVLVLNRFIVLSLFWWFYPHLRHGNTPGGHWLARCSFFLAWGRCNFLSLLLSADLSAELQKPKQVVAAPALNIVSGSFIYHVFISVASVLPPSSARATGGRLACWSLPGYGVQVSQDPKSVVFPIARQLVTIFDIIFWDATAKYIFTTSSNLA